MGNLPYVEELLKNYHSSKKQIKYLTQLINLPILESLSDTIEELNFKGESLLHPGRSP